MKLPTYVDYYYTSNKKICLLILFLVGGGAGDAHVLNISIHILYACLFVCPFVSNKHQVTPGKFHE